MSSVWRQSEYKCLRQLAHATWISTKYMGNSFAYEISRWTDLATHGTKLGACWLQYDSYTHIDTIDNDKSW